MIVFVLDENQFNIDIAIYNFYVLDYRLIFLTTAKSIILYLESGVNLKIAFYWPFRNQQSISKWL